MIDLRQFQVLRAVAVHGSLAGAARHLRFGQPTISYHLSALESHLGARLVERGPAGAVLTDVGAMVLEHASGVLDRVQAMESDVRASLAHGLATIRVGAFTTAATKLLPRPLRRAVAGSGVRVELTEAEPLDLLTRVRSGALHCALIYDVAGAKPGYGADLRVERLFDDPFRLLLPAGRDTPDGPVDLASLAGAGWLISESGYDPSDQILIATCQSLGFRPRIVLRSDSYSVIHGFVAAGDAVALVPELALEAGHEVVVRDTVQEVGARGILFVTPAGEGPPVVERLRAELHRAYGGGRDKRGVPPGEAGL
ncbi:LysR substrate-binding domain-containing protein [Nonomuraea sp. NPDC050310]|uniref:LysR family transcriptional regulator n=1 Tax=unclassified Nonomuraea TaxID=2593643 RepID=UPI0034119A5F